MYEKQHKNTRNVACDKYEIARGKEDNLQQQTTMFESIYFYTLEYDFTCLHKPNITNTKSILPLYP